MMFLRPWTPLIGLFLVASISSAAEKNAAQSPSPSPNPTATANPATLLSSSGFDVAKIAAKARPAVALISVQDKEGKTQKIGTGFFVAADGKLVTNAHVLEGATTAEAKLENGASYRIIGILKQAVDRDLVIAKVDAKDLPFVTLATDPMPEPGTRIVVVGSPFGLEGSVSEGIISGQRTAKKDDEWLQLTAPISAGSSGSPILDAADKVVGVATFVIAKGQAVNFARPVEYVSDLLKQIASSAEPEPLWTLAADPKNVVLNDPEFLDAEKALQNDDAAEALKTLNKLQPKYADNAPFLFKLGLVYDRLNLSDDAIKAYQHALRIDPSNGLGWTNLALTYVKLGKFTEAKDAATQAVKQAPDFGPAWGVLGYSYQQDGRLNDAADALQKAAKLTPKEPQIWRNLSDTYARLNEPAKSQQAGAKADELVAPQLQVTPAPSWPQTSPTIASTSLQRRTAVVVAPATKGLNLRAAPDGRSKVITKLQTDDRVFIDGGLIHNNEPPSPVVWQHVITSQGESGWFDREYLGAIEGSTEQAADRQVWELFEKWLAVNNTDPTQEALLYADPIDYLERGSLSRQQLAAVLQEDLQRWPKQHNRVSEGPLVEKISDSEWRVSFELTFDVRNPVEVKRVTGVGKLTWTVHKTPTGGVEIASAKEQVTTRTIHSVKRMR